MRTETCFGEINCFSMNFSKFDAIFIFGVVGTLISFDKMAVIDLSKFFVVEILDEEVNHLSVLLIDIF